MRGVLPDGQQIWIARIARGVTQEQLAVCADLDVKTIRKAEQGKRLDVETLAGLARALDVDMQTLVRGEASPDALAKARRAIVERWVAAWDAQDIEALMSRYHDDAVLHLPGGSGLPVGGRFEGKPAIRRGNQQAWDMVKTLPQSGGEYSLVVHNDTVILDGTKTVCLPDGRRVPLSCVQVFKFSGELIVEHRVEYDTLEMGRLLAPADRQTG